MYNSSSAYPLSNTLDLTRSGTYKPNTLAANPPADVSAVSEARAYSTTAEIEAFVCKHERQVFRTAMAIMANKADAEDAMQEVFLKIILESRKSTPVQFASDEHEAAWVTRVTVNQCNSIIRGYKRKKTVPLEDIVETYSVNPHDNESKRLTESINALDPKHRAAVYLFYYEGYSTKEIADITKQNESTVRSHLARARKKLKDLITEAE
ncbi:MAG: sigma-70 family RNA polymerase sigma factor [Oscillospiraceae bacterium]|nr:sigma-70 family RNA polymerase sigma factor [Oscillospiraceae bacterium]